MLQNAYLLAKIGADTAENERNFAEILPTTDNYPTDAHDVRVLRHVHGAGRRAVAPDPIPDRNLLRPMTPDREGRVKSEQTYLHLNCQIWNCAKSV